MSHTHPACITFLDSCPACREAQPERVAMAEKLAEAAYTGKRRELQRKCKRAQRAEAREKRGPKQTWTHVARVRREAARAKRRAMYAERTSCTR